MHALGLGEASAGKVRRKASDNTTNETVPDEKWRAGMAGVSALSQKGCSYTCLRLTLAAYMFMVRRVKGRTSFMRTFVIFMCVALSACGEEGLRRTVVGRATCNSDAMCPAGSMCTEGVCAPPLAPQDVPVSSTSSMLEAVGQSAFNANNGSFSLKFTVASNRTGTLIGAMTAAKLRTRFVDGDVHLWGLEIDTPGGEVTVPTKDGDRLYFVTNVRVRSVGEIVLPLMGGDGTRTSVLAKMDVDVSADVGASETESVRLSARLEQLPFNVEFIAGQGDDKRLHARLVVAEDGGLYGPPSSGLSIDGLAVDADLTGVEIPGSWLKP